MSASCPSLKRLQARRFSLPLFHAALLATASLAPASLAAQDADLDYGGNLDLPEISVTANLVPTPLEQVGSAVTVITGEEMKKQNIRLVSQILRQVPGVAVSRTGPVGQWTDVRIRGSEPNQTKVFIDGIAVNDPAADSAFDFAHLLADDIERIEILRGPQSALYGSDAAGGVINIITKRGDGPVRTSAKVEGGSFGTFNGNASVSGSGERYNFIASVSGMRTDGISAASTRLGNTERDAYENVTVFGKSTYNLTDNLEVAGVVRYVNHRVDLDTDLFVPSLGHTAPVDSLEDVKGEQIFTRAQTRLLLLDGHWEQVAGVTYTDQNRRFRNLAPRQLISTFDGYRTRVDYQSNFFLDTPALFDASHTFTVAVSHDEDKAVSRSIWSSFNEKVGSTGYVGEYKVNLAKALTLTGSIRHDDNDVFKDSTTYRNTAAYVFDRTGTKLRGSYGTGVKNPTLFELYGYIGNYHGNPDLKPEHAKGWDAGFDQEIFGLGTFHFTYFDQRISDLIAGAGETSINLPGESKINGVEVGLTVQPVENVTVRASYTYTDGVDADGNPLIRRPKHIASLNVGYSFLDNRAQLNLGIDYNGKQTDWVWSEFWDEHYEVKLKAYTLVSLSGTYRLNDSVELFGRLENILDQKYYEVYGYGTPGFSGYAGLRVTF